MGLGQDSFRPIVGAARTTGRSGFAFLQASCKIGVMALDPSNPPIWLRKLHVAAEQISPSDYAPTPEDGILRGCRLSDALHEWSAACADALGLAPLPPPPPFDNPLSSHSAPAIDPSESQDDRAFP